MPNFPAWKMLGIHDLEDGQFEEYITTYKFKTLRVEIRKNIYVIYLAFPLSFLFSTGVFVLDDNTLFYFGHKSHINQNPNTENLELVSDKEINPIYRIFIDWYKEVTTGETDASPFFQT